MKKRLIITGAGGFFGGYLIPEALKYGFDEIVAVTSDPEKLTRRFTGAGIISAVSRKDHLNGNLKLTDRDIVINCAYPRTGKGEDIVLGLEYIDFVFRESAAAGVAGIINISSQSVYDPTRTHPASEADIPVLSDGYAIGKYCSEMLLRNICCRIPYTNVRLASLIGPGFDSRVPNKMTRYALSTGKIHVEEGNQKFGYLDVRDAAAGLMKLSVRDPESWKAVYNLGSDHACSLLELAELISEQVRSLAKKDVQIECSKSTAVLNSTLNSERLKDSIGEYVYYDISQSIRDIVLFEMERLAEKEN